MTVHTLAGKMTKSTETLHQTLSLMTVLLNELSLGLGSGWIAPTLKLLRTSAVGNLVLTMEECSWIASLDHFGKIFGAILAAIFLDITGRKNLLMYCALLFFLQWVLILFGNSAMVLYIARIAFGVAFGINDGTNSVYLGENSSPLIRGIFGAVAISLNFLGLMAEIALGTYASYRTTAAVNTAITFLCVLSVFWMKEPVQYLIMRGKYQKAEKNFLWLRGVTDVSQVKSEFEKITQNVHSESTKKSSIRTVLTSRANYKSVTIMFVIYALAASTGYYPIISFASLFFTETNILTADELTILIGVFQFVIISSTSIIVDRFPRRTIIMVSFSCIALVHAGTALIYYVHHNIVPVPYFPWLIFIGVSLFVGLHAFVYPAIFLIRSELFPLSIKAIGGCISVVGYAALSFLTTKMFLYIYQFYGFYLNFLIFSAISLLLVLYVYWVLPETRNKSLVEIQEDLERKK